MLTQLSTVKSRLAIPDTDVTQDDLLTFAIEAMPVAQVLKTYKRWTL